MRSDLEGGVPLLPLQYHRPHMEANFSAEEHEQRSGIPNEVLYRSTRR